MNFNNLIKSGKKLFHRTKFSLTKKQPTIMVIGGVILGVGTGIYASVQSTKLSKLKSKKEQDLKEIEEFEPQGEEDYDEDDRANDIKIVKAKYVKDVVVLYSGPVILGALSVASILVGHGLLKKRYVALGTAYVALDTSFKNYRKRVADKYGEEAEEEIRYGITPGSSGKTEEIVEGKNKKEVPVNDLRLVDPTIKYSEYAVLFCPETSDHYGESDFHNDFFIETEQAWANDVLRSQGYLFMNYVRERLGLNPTKAGQVVGWVYKKNNKTGDNYIDLKKLKVDYCDNNGDVKTGWLVDFNVDGPILFDDNEILSEF